MNARTTPPPPRAPRDASLLRARARWIMTVTLVAVLSACVLSWVVQRPHYESEVQVIVDPRLPPGGAALPPDMETEVEVATSGLVTAEAARTSGTSAADLRERLSVTVPPETTVLVFRYSDATPAAAHGRAAAIADAYIAYRADEASILTPATTPRTTTGPDYLVNSVAGLALGLLLGLGSALLRDRRDDRLRGPRDFAERTGLALLTTVPAAGTAPVAPGQPLAVLAGTDTPAAEAYRYLRVKLLQAAAAREQDGAPAPLLVQVTSAVHDDGATATAANTAVALARGGQRVVLVEADLRDPALAGPFDLDEDPGLTDVLAGRLPVGRVLRASTVDGLRVLPGGHVRSSPGELLGTPSLRALLAALPGDADCVVVDSPPVLTAAEALALAPLVHLVVLVATAGDTARQELVAAASEVQDAGGHLLGGVLHLGPSAGSGRAPSSSGARRSADAAAAQPAREAGPVLPHGAGGPGDGTTHAPELEEPRGAHRTA